MSVENWAKEEAENTASTLASLKEEVDICYELKCEIRALEKIVTQKKSDLSEKEGKLKAVMELAGVTVLPGEECIYELVEDPGYRRPTEPSEEDAFRHWFVANKGIEAFNAMFKMNAQTQKALIRKEYEANEDVDGFSIPGVPAPLPFTYLKQKPL